MIDRVNEVVSNYIEKHFKLSDLKLIKSDQGNMGAFKDFEFHNLIIRVVNDRGLVDIAIGSKFNKNTLRGISFFKDHLSPANNGGYNMSIEDQVVFLSEKFEVLNKMMGRFSNKLIIKKIDDEQREILENRRILKR